jgi:hypothetical protein
MVPNLLGCLLFISKNSKDIERQEQYYCLISWIFIPWSYECPHMIQNQSWKEFYDTNKDKLSPCLLQYIANLDLLHKSKEESQIDILQQKARSDEDAINAWIDDEIPKDVIYGEDDDDDYDDLDQGTAQTDCDIIIEDIVFSSTTSKD